ncbi:hypothetical protein TNCV_1191461 [Trichonephila clavipes]|nr:hypothetical protein TNCV_1191461 [Trichonephila clavipes]
MGTSRSALRIPLQSAVIINLHILTHPPDHPSKLPPPHHVFEFPLGVHIASWDLSLPCPPLARFQNIDKILRRISSGMGLRLPEHAGGMLGGLYWNVLVRVVVSSCRRGIICVSFGSIRLDHYFQYLNHVGYTYIIAEQ